MSQAIARTTTMLSKRELRLRRKYLGSSEIGVVAGHSLYRNATPFSVWKDKTFGDDENAPSPAMKAGSHFEPGIASYYKGEIGEDDIKLYKDRRRVHRKHRWLSASCDYAVMRRGKRIRTLECKFVGPGQEHHWDIDSATGVPLMYQSQVHQQMDVNGDRVVDVAAFFARSRELHVWRLKWDRAFYREIFEEGKRFWHEHVVAGVPPEIDGSPAAASYLQGQYRSHGPAMLPAAPEVERLAREYAELTAQEAEAKERKQELRNQICAKIGDAAGVVGPWGKCTWKNKAGAIDTSAALADLSNMLELRGMRPDEVNQTIEHHRKDSSRSFRCTLSE